MNSTSQPALKGRSCKLTPLTLSRVGVGATRVVFVAAGAVYIAAAVLALDEGAGTTWRFVYGIYGAVQLLLGLNLKRWTWAYFGALGHAGVGVVLCLVRFRPFGLALYLAIGIVLLTPKTRRELRSPTHLHFDRLTQT